MADNEFVNRAAQLAATAVETELINASRDYEDAVRAGDEHLAADAMRRYAQTKRDYDELTGANQPQQQSGELSVAQRNFLSRRVAGGDQLDAQRVEVYRRGHQRALDAGLTQDSPEYFRAIEWYADHQGDGRIAPLSEAEAAQISGVDQSTYAAHAARLRALKASGHYNE